MTTDYRPVACALHSELELLCMSGRPVALSWSADHDAHSTVATPLDVITRDRAEFLVADTAEGERIEIRLDRLGPLPPVRARSTR